MTPPAAHRPWSTHIRAVVPGAALALIVGGTALELQRVLPARWALPDVLVALIVGSLVVNSPLSETVRVWRRHDRGRNRYGAGLMFVGKTVLRASVVLMGLDRGTPLRVAPAPGDRPRAGDRLADDLLRDARPGDPAARSRPAGRSDRLGDDDLRRLGRQRRGAGDRCPPAGAGVALATIFLYSAVALVLFRAVAAAAGLDAHQAGIWSGLAVNDLASAVAVGAQMGAGGAEMAAVSKSARVLMLAPVLILFSLWRAEHLAGDRPVGLGRTVVGHIPGFVVGFLILALLRAAGDRLFGQAANWRTTLMIDRQVVAFATVTVSAGIGLHLEIKGLLSAGARAVVLGAAACATMSGLTLTLMVLASRGLRAELVLTSVAAVGGSFAVWQLVRRTRAFLVISAEMSRRQRTVTTSGPVFMSAAAASAAASAASALTASGAHRRAPATGERRLP